MAFNDKSMDPKVLSAAMMEIIEGLLSKMGGIVPTDAPQIKESDISEYEGRMRVAGVEKFNAMSVISTINFYLTAKDQERHKAKGALVLYVECENAGKLFNAFGFRVNEDEDDASLMDSCGKVCGLLATGLKTKLTSLGYDDFVMSNPSSFKNSIMGGTDISPDQTTKHEFSFFYWKRKAIVVELTLAAIPKKK